MHGGLDIEVLLLYFFVFGMEVVAEWSTWWAVAGTLTSPISVYLLIIIVVCD